MEWLDAVHGNSLAKLSTRREELSHETTAVVVAGTQCCDTTTTATAQQSGRLSASQSSLRQRLASRRNGLATSGQQPLSVGNVRCEQYTQESQLMRLQCAPPSIEQLAWDKSFRYLRETLVKDEGKHAPLRECGGAPAAADVVPSASPRAALQQQLHSSARRILTDDPRGCSGGEAAGDADELFEWQPSGAAAGRVKDKPGPCEDVPGKKRARASSTARTVAAPQAAAKRARAAAAMPAVPATLANTWPPGGEMDGGGRGGPTPFYDGEDVPLILCADVRGNLCAEDNPDGVALQLEVPAPINRYLRPYQKDGVRFLFRQYARGTGGLLADDMGLGKTVQTIAFICALLGKACDSSDASTEVSQRAPILIVCPTSVLSNWARELAKWGGGYIRVATAHERKTRDAVLLDAAEGRVEVVLTSYGMVHQHIDAIAGVPWHAVIADEVHLCKNRRSERYKSICAIGTPYRYGLTGTVMPNDYMELWTLCDWVAPTSFGLVSEFRDTFAKPMREGQSKRATEEEVQRGRQLQERFCILRDKFLLRRTKDLIKDQLPQKIDNIVFCELSMLQKRAYRRMLASPEAQLLVRMNEMCDCGSGQPRCKCCYMFCHKEQGGVLWPRYHMCTCENPRTFLNPKGCNWHKPDGCPGPCMRCPMCLIMPMLIVLQKICNHLDMLKLDKKTAESRPETIAEQLDLQFKHDLLALVLGQDLEVSGGPVMDENFISSTNTSRCGKMAALEQLLKQWKRNLGDKVLLFSHSCRMLNVVERLVIKKGYDYVRLDGSTPQPDRQRLVDQFNASPSLFLFLISTTAGGLGLNLTAANRVVVIDPSWNPAYDLQAQDRAFRIGQQRDVHVYRMVSSGSLEEHIYMRQIYKQQQSEVAIANSKEKRHFEGVQDDKGKQGELFGIVNLLRESADRVATMEILDETKQLEYEVLEKVQLDAAVAPPQGGSSAPGHGCSGSGGHLGALDVEDAGLVALALASEDPDAGAAAAPGGAGAGAHAAPASPQLVFTDSEEDGAGSADEAGSPAAPLDPLAGVPGVMGLRLHDDALGSSALEQILARRGSRGSAGAVAPAGPPAGGAGTAEQAGGGGLVESLAAWKGVGVVEMAQWLRDLGVEQRTELRMQYADDEGRNPP